MPSTEDKARLEETLTFIQTIWMLFLAALYLTCFYDEYRFPGQRTTPEEGEEILWLVQNVMFFGMMGLGFLADIVQMRIDRGKAFMYLVASLVLGGMASMIGAVQYHVVRRVAGIFGVEFQ